MYKMRVKTGDITFKIGDEKIKAHKCVLAALSPKYEAQFFGGDFKDKIIDVIEVMDVSATAFEEFLQFFYLSSVQLTHEKIEDVLKSADELMGKEIVKVCYDFLTETLSVDTVCLTYHVCHTLPARNYSVENKELIDRCEQLISLNSEEVYSSPGFNKCAREDIFNILQLDSLNCKETEVTRASPGPRTNPLKMVRIRMTVSICARCSLDQSDLRQIHCI